jgi:hypothetical protein
VATQVAQDDREHGKEDPNSEQTRKKTIKTKGSFSSPSGSLYTKRNIKEAVEPAGKRNDSESKSKATSKSSSRLLNLGSISKSFSVGSQV